MVSAEAALTTNSPNTFHVAGDDNLEWDEFVSYFANLTQEVDDDTFMNGMFVSTKYCRVAVFACSVTSLSVWW